MNIVSFFAGGGGMDIGFHNAGFKTIWANEFDKGIWETWERNNPGIPLDHRSITDIQASEVPDCDGMVGGPPCQSWSTAGFREGYNNPKGQLFHDYIRILREKQPKFFLAENVRGMTAPRHAYAMTKFKEGFMDCGYNLSFALLNASDYDCPQDRWRVFFIGFRKDLDKKFLFPKPSVNRFTMRDAIWDLKDNAVLGSGPSGNTHNPDCEIPNHEYFTVKFSPRFMQQNRVKTWDMPSNTIVATGNAEPLHPQAPKMMKFGYRDHRFVEGSEHLYRRMTVRECARLQTFPDDHIFYYDKLEYGYRMVGNAVPCNLAFNLATAIKKQLEK